MESIRKHFQEESLDYVCKLQEIQERKKFECVEPVSDWPYMDVSNMMAVLSDLQQTKSLKDPVCHMFLPVFSCLLDAGLLSDSLHLLSPGL